MIRHKMNSAPISIATAALVFALLLFVSVSARSQAFEKSTVMIPMPDGVNLATDLYIPKSDKKVPVVLVRTTYNKDTMNVIQPFMAGKGVALAVQDTRGRYASEGVSSVFIDDSLDGYETVEWLAKQPWCNGRVGTAGISALGITQYVMHKKPSPHLVCQHVMAAPESLYDTIVYQGGAVRRALFYGWILGQKYPMQMMNLILSQVDYNPVWEMMDITPNFEEIDIPIMHMSGWYDLYTRGNLNAFKAINERGGPNARGKQRLVVGPWTHEGFLALAGVTQGDLTYPGNSRYDLGKIIEWFQECLQGRDKGYLSGPAVRYYVMGDPETPGAPGNEWRSADAWPIPAENTVYYMSADGSLATSKPADEGALAFKDDPWNPVPTLGSRAHGLQRHPVDLRPIEQRDDVLVFTTPPLEQPLEVTGPITAKIFFTTDVPDTDIVVRLSDVYPDGRSMLVTDGIARAQKREGTRSRKLLTPGESYEMDIEVWPTSLIFNTGHSLRVVVSGTNFPRFDINSHNGRYHNVKPGKFEKALETGLEEFVYTPDPADDAVVANTTIHMSADKASRIILPIVK